jgi:hypothetical protein
LSRCDVEPLSGESGKPDSGHRFVMGTDDKFYREYRKLQKQLFDPPNKIQSCIFPFDSGMLMGVPLTV